MVVSTISLLSYLGSMISVNLATLVFVLEILIKNLLSLASSFQFSSITALTLLLLALQILFE